MAETLLSPGVLARETDQSFIQGQPVQAGAAIVGPAAKGPVGIPTLVTSPSEYDAVFGTTTQSGSRDYSYLTRKSAYNYFEQGESLLVTRVQYSGSSDLNGWGGATSTTITAQTGSITNPFKLKTISQGTAMNSVGPEGDNNKLASGSRENLRWEIQNVNNSNGEFSLLIRRGNDNSKNKNILKTFQNVSLDPNKSNYISKVIGDSYSEVKNDGTDYFVKTYGEYPNTQPYVYVAEVNNPTLDYSDVNGEVNTDNNGISFSGSLPLVSSGSFENGTGDLHPTELGASKFNENISSTNIQGVNPEAYIESFNLLTNTDDYRFNILTAPGLNNEDHGTEVEKLASVATERQDCISVIDLVGYDTPLSTVTTQASNFNNSYAATYWPWLQTQMDGKNAWVPPSTLIPGVYAFTDRSSAAWFAPAGLTRGAINANKAERKLTAGNRDTLYAANVNPIATFPGSGVVVFGQKTLQKGASALDRVNVRRLLIELKSYISQISDNLVFEQNSIATRNSFLTQVNPYLEGIQQRQGLYAFKVVMDETNNTADVVDRNELVGQIYLQPTKTAEFILLDFNVTPTGASFPA